jgi:predicted dehydrogenase
MDLPPGRASLYEEALGRMRDVEISRKPGPDALITGDVAAAASSEAPCLLDGPETCRVEQVAALSPAGGRIMPAHEWRFVPEVIPVRRSSEDGKLGEPGLLRIHWWHTGPLPLRAAAFGQVDLAHWFFGSAAPSCHVLRRPDYLQLHLGYPGNGMAMIDIAAGRPGLDSYYSLHLIGSNGAAYADDHHNAQLLFGGNGARALLTARNRLLGMRSMLEEFVSGIVENRHWSVGLEDTAGALQTLKEGRVS